MVWLSMVRCESMMKVVASVLANMVNVVSYAGFNTIQMLQSKHTWPG
jgi:hypothetical protein